MLKRKDVTSRENGSRKESRANNDWHNLKLTYGNRHEIIAPKGVGRTANNDHKWTMFIGFANKKIDATKLISKVRFGMDARYSISYVDIKVPKENGCFEISFTGWDTWTVPITITFKGEVGRESEQRTLELSHKLCFEGEGKW